MNISKLAFLQKIPFKLTVIYAAICMFSGQFYPFSEFPMYSYFPNCATVYFLQDGKSNPIFIYPELNRNVPNLKQQIEHRALSYFPDFVNDSTIFIASKEVFEEMMSDSSGHAMLSKYGEVKLVQTTYCVVDGNISRRDTTLSSKSIHFEN